MDTLIRFGNAYTFDADQQISLRDNFRDIVPRTSRLPGLSGGFDEYGDDPAPTEIGNVQVVFWVEADTPVAMQTAKQAVGAMKIHGVQKLYKRAIGDRTLRFCEARVNSIDFTERAADLPHKRIRIEVNFQVASPVWLNAGTFGWLWGDGSVWGGGQLWGGSPVVENLVGSSNTFSVTPDGNDIVYPIITVTIPAGGSATNIRIQRLVSNVVVDEVQYDDTLAAGDELVIDCQALSITLNGSDAYGATFDFETAAWMRLLAGETNTIRVLMDNTSDEATVAFSYYSAFNV